MALERFILPPGFDKTSTRYSARGRWFDGDKVRSIGEFIETMGGWEQFTIDEVFEGKCRGLFTWLDNSQGQHIGIGTHRRLYEVADQQLTNITPVRTTGSLSDAISTVSGDETVTITHTSHGIVDQTYANFSGQGSPVDGITLDGDYAATVVDANTYTVEASSAATGTTNGGGGNLDYEYEINVGGAYQIPSIGYGVGSYGADTYGTPRTTSLLLSARTWALDKWGEDLLALPRGGDLYLWDKSAGGRATRITQAPRENTFMFVTPERHVVLLGAGGDALGVQVCDQEDYTEWTAAADNQAASFRVSQGNLLMAGTPLRGGVSLIWTDTTCYRMPYLRQEPWFDAFPEGSGAGLAGPNAWCEFGGVAYWMSQKRFYGFAGAVFELPNQDDVASEVFDNIATDQWDLVFCFPMKRFAEIWWLYTVAGDTEISRYVVFNLRDQRWYTGTIVRTAWVDQDLFPTPLATGTDGYLYEHEVGEDADGEALQKYVESGLVDLSDGDEIMDIFGVLPDFDDQVGDVVVTVKTADAPNETPTADDTATATPSSGMLDIRASGRHAAVRYESNELGGRFRQGVIRFDIQSSGRRRAR